MRAYVSKVPNGEDATAVRVLWKQGRRQVGLQHVGTGHSPAEIALLVATAHQIINAGQESLPGVCDELSLVTAAGDAGGVVGARVTSTTSAVLWDTLGRVWSQLGFDAAVPDGRSRRWR